MKYGKSPSPCASVKARLFYPVVTRRCIFSETIYLVTVCSDVVMSEYLYMILDSFVRKHILMKSCKFESCHNVVEVAKTRKMLIFSYDYYFRIARKWHLKMFHSCT
jgi:hypothetical protein